MIKMTPCTKSVFQIVVAEGIGMVRFGRSIEAVMLHFANDPFAAACPFSLAEIREEIEFWVGKKKG